MIHGRRADEEELTRTIGKEIDVSSDLFGSVRDKIGDAIELEIAKGAAGFVDITDVGPEMTCPSIRRWRSSTIEVIELYAPLNRKIAARG